MPDFIVRSRKTGAITDSTVTAESREEATVQVVKSVAEGESIEVMDVKEIPADTAGAGGATGPTGTSGTE